MTLTLLGATTKDRGKKKKEPVALSQIWSDVAESLSSK